MQKISNIRTSGVDKELELINKRKFLETRKIESQFSQVMEQLNSEGSLDLTDEDMIFASGSIAKENEEYINAIHNKMTFINTELSDFICLGGKTLYLICGGTGSGKSTTVGAIIHPLLDKKKRILVISNEEAREDVYNRVACQRLGKSFQLYKQAALHPEENRRITEEAEMLTSILTVIDTSFKNNPDFVTTPQGVASIMEKFGSKHDMIILDYYQNISRSTASTGDLRPEPHVHQLKFANWINSFKNRYGKPIIVLSQIRKPNKGDTQSFEERLMGSKYIGVVSLMHIEVRPDFTNWSTTFICHKDRFWGKTGKGFQQGFDWTKNSFVPYDDAFQAKAAQWQIDFSNKPQDKAQDVENGQAVEEDKSGDTSAADTTLGDDPLVLDGIV